MSCEKCVRARVSSGGRALSCCLEPTRAASRALTRPAAVRPTRRCWSARRTPSLPFLPRASAPSRGLSSGPQARGTCAASLPTRARSSSSGTARGRRAVNARSGAGNRGARAAQPAKALTPTGAADILPKTVAPEFKKPVLTDLFFEEQQFLRFQVRHEALHARCARASLVLTAARAAHVRRCSASSSGPGHDRRLDGASSVCLHGRAGERWFLACASSSVARQLGRRG